MRRAQIEIMGLVIIVVLVVIGLFFSLALRSPTESRPVSQVYSDEKLASDFLITFLETTEPTCSATMRDIAIDCIRYNVSGQHRYNCKGLDSCAFINDSLHNISSNTLDPWGISYVLSFTHTIGEETEELVRVDHTQCDDSRDQSAPGIQPIPLYGSAPGSALMKLEICT